MKFARPLTRTALTLTLAASLWGCKGHESYTDKGKNEAEARWFEVKADIALDMAEQHFNSGQLVLAEKTISDALQLDNDHPGLYLLAGRIAIENAQLESAYLRLQKSVEHGEALEDNVYSTKKKAQPYYYMGIVDQRWQRYEDAKDNYNQAYERDPENVAYFLARVEMMVQMGQLEQAVSDLEAKTTYYDQNPTVRALLAHVYRRLGKHDKAALWFGQAATLAPEDMKLREELARSQVQVGEYDEAARTLRALTKTEYGSERADLRRLLAEAYVAAGKLRDARGVYVELTSMDRSSVPDWSKLGELAYRLGDEGAALQAANQMINLAPDDHRGYLLAGMVWNKRDRLDRALSMFDRASELAPEQTTPLILRGIALQKSDRPAAAADAYKQALQIDPDDTRAQRLLSSVSENLR
ncbi:MAG: tetratricopeptide repeat protein [Phycisphaeraceae bacterium]